MGLFDSTKSLAEAYAERKARELQHRGTADTRVDDPINNRRSATFDGQEIDRDTLTDIRDMRESGGVISQLVRSKALMQHGTGVEWQAENEAVKEWLEDTFGNLDNLLIDLGEDAIWYPYSVAELVETRGGGFSHVEPIEPWTMLPSEDEYGEVIGWTQVVQQEFDTVETPYDPEEIAHFVLSKASARDNTGISEVKRAEAEIEAYRNHSQAVTNGIMLHGYPQRHVAVGREGGAMMDDNDLRRVRNQFDEWDTDTVWVTGADVDISEIEAQNFEFDKVTEHDLRKLALALGLPLELANVGSDGLGSGMPAELRKQLFERQARAAQRALADQFVTQVARPVLEEYSPFPADDVDVSLTFGDPVNSMESKNKKIQAIGEDMTVNERRAEFDMSKLEGDEGEEYESPGASEEGGGGPFDMLNSERELQEVPDNAQPIDDPADCDGSVIEGPRGGTYCVPQGDGDGESTPGSGDSMEPSDVDSGNVDEYFEENFTDVDVTEVGDQKIVDFNTFPGIDYPIKSSFVFDDTGVSEGAARFGELEPDELTVDGAQEGEIGRAWVNMVEETGLGNMAPVEADTGDFDDTIMHLRVNESFEENRPETDDFMEGFEELRAIVAGVVSSPPDEMTDFIYEFESGRPDSDAVSEVKERGESALSESSVEMSIHGGNSQAITRLNGDSGNLSLEDGAGIPEWDRALMEMQHGVHGESDTHLLSYSASGTPEFAKERLRDAILSEGLFSQFDTIPSGERQQLREYFLETLQSDGWTVDSLADQIEQLGADTDDAERIARTETHELLADARERGYEERGDGDERFKWVGTYDDGRTTEACQWLLEQTNPKHGGDPVGLERLKELVQEAPEHDPDVNTEPREWTPHISCRKTFVRHVEG